MVQRLSDQDYGAPKVLPKIGAVYFNAKIAPHLWKDESDALDLAEAIRRFPTVDLSADPCPTGRKLSLPALGRAFPRGYGPSPSAMLQRTSTGSWSRSLKESTSSPPSSTDLPRS